MKKRGRYAVLGWYMVRDAWEELEPGKPVKMKGPDGKAVSQTKLLVRWKFLFEWVEAQGEPWWIYDLEEAAKKFVDSPCDVRRTMETVEVFGANQGYRTPLIGSQEPTSSSRFSRRASTASNILF